MVINTRKSCCLRIGPRSDVACASVYTTTGVALPWVNDLRYLGVFIIRSRTFKCSLHHARKSFYRSANYIFGKAGRIASEEVIKCIPVLLYGLEACPLTKSDLSAIDFVVNRFFVKLFRTNNIKTVKSCQYYFNFQPPSLLWSERVNKI